MHLRHLVHCLFDRTITVMDEDCYYVMRVFSCRLFFIVGTKILAI
jgi:hypothetical protein